MGALLAEDDRMIGEAVVNALKDASYAVDWVRDGDAASEALAVMSTTSSFSTLGCRTGTALPCFARAARKATPRRS